MALSVQAQQAFDEANAAYIALPGKLQPRITYRSERRDVFRQAQLREKYWKFKLFGGIKANAADLPGESTHQYGVAIDVNIEGDPQRIGDSLRAHRWRDPYPKEPWHFDAVGTGDYATAIAIAGTLSPQYQDWGNTLDAVLRIEHRVEVAQKRIMPLTNQVNLADQRAKGAQQGLKLLMQQLRQLEFKVAQEEERVESAVREEQVRYQAHAGYKFNMCPNGYPFEDCSHEPEKAAYLQERSRRYDAWKQAQAKLDALSPGLAALRNRLRSESAKLEPARARTQRLTDDAKRLAEQLRDLRQEIQANRSLAAERRRRMGTLLSTIAAGVGAGP